MSSRAVRVWFRSFVPAAVPSVPYVETTNQAPNPKNLPDLWFTMEFAPPSEQRLTLGSQPIFREFGNVSVVVLGLSGRGDDAVVQAAELFREALMGIALEIPVGATVGYLYIDAPEPPSTEATESGNWFLASVSCSYTLDVVREV
jgi:hypothetical protein